ncbi:type II secretion system F family protein [Raineyella fluvialis]|uniref:Type II secretion system protein F n=1 Tax=Raineyella fluvialis TaxID=2662261 RepID=A0A5Q2FBZ1_9ACTN|nr:type II secretion system F family protein [Raineyella fluvialis]QGF24299.1 type II secretion system protein F [Raineyella fluvialis]
MSLFDSPAIMWMGISLLIAAIALAFAALAPRRYDLPMSRRRPDVPPPPGLLARLTAAATRGVGRLMAGRGDGLQEMLYLAGVRSDPRDFVLLVLSASVLALAAGLVAANFVIGLLLALIVPVVARLGVSFQVSRRRAAFSNQLDEILQTLAANLRAGTSLPQAMQVLAQEADEPAQGEFVRVGNELRVGRPMNSALEAVADRMQSTDFSWVAQAISINREVGGNLADVLDGIAETMRQRGALRRQVDALSAEGKMSGWVLMALPFGMFLLVSLTNPHYFDSLIHDPLGWLMIAAGVVLLVIGGVWLRAATSVKY